MTADYASLIRPTSSLHLRLRQKDIGPCSCAGPGGCPQSLSFRSPKKIEGDGAPTRRMIRITPGRPGSAWLPGEPRNAPEPWCERRAGRTPRLAARQRGIFGLGLINGRTGQELFVPGGLFRASPVGRVASSPSRRLPLPFPALKTPHECAPRRVDRDRLNIITLQVKSSIISLAE